MIDRKTAVMMAMGFEIVGIILVAIYAGGWLNEKYALKNNLGTVICIIVGIVGWITHVLLAVRAIDKQESDSDSQ